MIRRLLAVLAGLCCGLLPLSAQEEVNAWPGPVRYQDNDERSRERYLGPLFERVEGAGQHWSVFRPFFYEERNEAEETVETHLLYPFLAHEKGKHHERWRFLNYFSHTVARTSESEQADVRSTLLPVLYRRETGEEESSYFGLFPLLGTIKPFLGADSISWAAFPLYVRFQEKSVSRKSVLWPVIQWFEGEGAEGSALWPLIGHFREEGRYDYRYALWPLVFHKTDYLSAGERVRQGVLPFYQREEGPRGLSETFLWPFFGYSDLTGPEYHERRYLWPLWVQAVGENKKINRWAPFFSHSVIHGVEKSWFLWPLLKEKKWEEGPLTLEQDQFLYFLYWSHRQRRTGAEEGPEAEVTYLWPLLAYWNNGAGREQVQFLDPLSVFFPHNHKIRRNYTPLFGLYRADKDEQGHTRQSLLFDLVVTEDAGERQKLEVGPLLRLENKSRNEPAVSLLEGLIGYEEEAGEKTLQLLWQDISLPAFSDEEEED